MYNVMIVDDEELIRIGLTQLIDWEVNGLYIAGCASNGVEAMRIFGSTPVDIVITDIRMPEMDGFELISTLHRMNKSVRFIVISSYQDFNYVKRAAILGIENYIVKPIDDNELLNTLISTIDKLDQEKAMNQVNLEGFDIIENNILYRWIAGMIDEFTLRERIDFIHVDIWGPQYVLAYITDISGNARRSNLLFKVRNFSLQNRSSPLSSFSFLDLEGNAILVFYGVSVRDEMDSIKMALAQLSSWLRTAQGIEVHMAVSSVTSGFQNVPKLYTEVLLLKEKSASQPTEGIVYQNDSGSQPHAQNNNQGNNIIVSHLKSYAEKNYASDINLKIISYELGMNAFYIGQIFKVETGDTFNHYLNMLRIGKAKSLLENSPTKASDVAEKVGYSNPNYFYTLFKKIVGMSPTQYKSQNYTPKSRR